MFQPEPAETRPSTPPERARRRTFNAGETIIEHVSNSSIEHPLIHLPKIFGIDFSVTKHVLMLWLVAAFVFVRRHRGRCAATCGRSGRCRPAS